MATMMSFASKTMSLRMKSLSASFPDGFIPVQLFTDVARTWKYVLESWKGTEESALPSEARLRRRQETKAAALTELVCASIYLTDGSAVTKECENVIQYLTNIWGEASDAEDPMFAFVHQSVMGLLNRSACPLDSHMWTIVHHLVENRLMPNRDRSPLEPNPMNVFRAGEFLNVWVNFNAPVTLPDDWDVELVKLCIHWSDELTDIQNSAWSESDLGIPLWQQILLNAQRRTEACLLTRLLQSAESDHDHLVLSEVLAFLGGYVLNRTESEGSFVEAMAQNLFRSAKGDILRIVTHILGTASLEHFTLVCHLARVCFRIYGADEDDTEPLRTAVRQQLNCMISAPSQPISEKTTAAEMALLKTFCLSLESENADILRRTAQYSRTRALQHSPLISATSPSPASPSSTFSSPSCKHTSADVQIDWLKCWLLTLVRTQIACISCLSVEERLQCQLGESMTAQLVPGFARARDFESVLLWVLAGPVTDLMLTEARSEKAQQAVELLHHVVTSLSPNDFEGEDSVVLETLLRAYTVLAVAYGGANVRECLTAAGNLVMRGHGQGDKETDSLLHLCLLSIEFQVRQSCESPRVNCTQWLQSLSSRKNHSQIACLWWVCAFYNAQTDSEGRDWVQGEVLQAPPSIRILLSQLAGAMEEAECVDTQSAGAHLTASMSLLEILALRSLSASMGRGIELPRQAELKRLRLDTHRVGVDHLADQLGLVVFLSLPGTGDNTVLRVPLRHLTQDIYKRILS